MERAEHLYIYAGISKGSYTSTTVLAGRLVSLGPVASAGLGDDHESAELTPTKYTTRKGDLACCSISNPLYTLTLSDLRRYPRNLSGRCTEVGQVHHFSAERFRSGYLLSTLSLLPSIHLPYAHSQLLHTPSSRVPTLVLAILGSSAASHSSHDCTHHTIYNYRLRRRRNTTDHGVWLRGQQEEEGAYR